MYNDVFIFVPSAKQIVRIAEGDGTNLLAEDEAAGYADYIYYDQHELGPNLDEVDGGQIMLEELFRDMFKTTVDCIPQVLGFVYGNPALNYIILE